MNEDTVPFPHLDRNTQTLLAAPLEERIKAALSDKFIIHALVKDHLALLKQDLNRPRCERPVCRLFIGPPNSGKSALAHKFLVDLGGEAVQRVGATEIQILVVEVPSRPTEPRLNFAIARGLHMPIASEAESRYISDLILRNLVLRKVKMIVFVEMDHFARLGADERDVVFDFIKNITNESIAVVGLGTEECVEVIRKNEALASRFRPRSLTGFSNDVSFADFVLTLESLYPLPEPSGLSVEPLVSQLFDRAKGDVGETVLYLNEAAAWALRNERTKIDQDALKNCGYTDSLRPPKQGKT